MRCTKTVSRVRQDRYSVCQRASPRFLLPGDGPPPVRKLTTRAIFDKSTPMGAYFTIQKRAALPERWRFNHLNTAVVSPQGFPNGFRCTPQPRQPFFRLRVHLPARWSSATFELTRSHPGPIENAIFRGETWGIQGIDGRIWPPFRKRSRESASGKSEESPLSVAFWLPRRVLPYRRRTECRLRLGQI